MKADNEWRRMSCSITQRTAEEKRLATNGVRPPKYTGSNNYDVRWKQRKWTANEGDVMVSTVCLRTADFLRVMWHNAPQKNRFFLNDKTQDTDACKKYSLRTLLAGKLFIQIIGFNIQKKPYGKLLFTPRSSSPCAVSVRSILLRDFLLYVILCRILPGPKPTSTTQLLRKTSDHGDERLWPLPWPVALWRPNQGHRRHPHTMDGDVCAWFCWNPSSARVVSAVADSGFSWLFGVCRILTAWG